VGREGSPHIVVTRKQKYIDSGFFGESDPEFIAHSRTDIPALIEEVEKLRKELRDAATGEN